MEENIFPQPAVAGVLAQMVEARLHYDSQSTEVKVRVKQLQEEMVQSFATPIYLVLDPNSGEVLGRRDGAMFDEDEFAAWLTAAVQKVK